jgi:hypothetical protein
VIVERDVEIPCSDGSVVRADIFRPDLSTDPDTAVPVVMTLGPYAKGLPYAEGYAPSWKWMTERHPDLLPGSSRELMTWETVDPETWVPWGYAVIRVDSRGAGRSPGRLDIFCPREIEDFYDAIEWAGTQPWSNGKVGLNGISYYAITQWLIAARQPPHLAAIVPWEGANDYYREFGRHGGILSNAFAEVWYPLQVISVQHGNAKAPRDPWLGEAVSGPEELDEARLAANRTDPVAEILARPLDGPYYRERSADLARVRVPFLSAANWGGLGLHARGNFEAFVQSSSPHKYLEVHTGRHEEEFYLQEGMALQKRFLDHFLKGEDNGWDAHPPVLLTLRRPFTDQGERRAEQEWPLARTRWTPAYLDAGQLLAEQPGPTAGAVSFDADGDPVTFTTAPLERETELTGPLCATLYISSSTTDADLFLTVQAFAPDGREVDFLGAIDPRTPLSQGWLRASHRKLDPDRDAPWRPWHTHDELQPLTPGAVYELRVEIWPTCIILPAGFRIALQISGHDFERDATANPAAQFDLRGSGLSLHTHPADRPRDIFAGHTTIHVGPDTPSHLLLPVVPPTG